MIEQKARVRIGATQESSYGPVTRQMLVRYAGASGDFNPMHYDDEFAKGAGFDSVFAQGMFTAGLLSGFATDWLGRDNIRHFRVRFATQVWLGDRLKVRGEVVAIEESDEGPLAVVELICERAEGGTAIKGSAAFLA